MNGMKSYPRSFGNEFVSKLLLIFLSLLIALLLCEGFLRVFLPQNLSGSWRVQSARGYAYNRAGGTVRHQLGKRVVTYRFNDQHLRGAPLDPNATRILVLGDSFTFGWLLEEEKTFVHLLQKKSDTFFGTETFQFLNGGAGGWGTADYLSFLEEFGESVSPDVVLVFLNVDDIARSLKSQLYSLVEGSDLELRSKARETSFSWRNTLRSFALYRWLLSHSHLLQFLRSSFMQLHRHTSTVSVSQKDLPLPVSQVAKQSTEEVLRFGKALFHRLDSWCRERGVLLWVLTTGWQNPEDIQSPNWIFLQHASEVFRELGIPFHDSTSEIQIDFTKLPEGSYYVPTDGHPNELGSELIAKHAWHWLKPKLEEIQRRE